MRVVAIVFDKGEVNAQMSRGFVWDVEERNSNIDENVEGIYVSWNELRTGAIRLVCMKYLVAAHRREENIL